MTSSLTTALEEMTINNEQLRRENDVIKSDNTQLRTTVDAMKNKITQQRNEITQQKNEITLQKNEIRQLQTKMVVDNESKMLQIYSQSTEIAQLRAENQQLKVSQWSGIISYSYTTPNIHTLRT